MENKVINNMENNNLQKYLSVKQILINSLLTIVTASAVFLVAIICGLLFYGLLSIESFVNNSMFWVIIVGPSAGILVVCVLYSVIFAFDKEPTGYIRTKIVNIMFIISMLFGIVVLLLIELWKSLFVPFLLIPLVVIGVGLYLNHKFQKTVNELAK